MMHQEIKNEMKSKKKELDVGNGCHGDRATNSETHFVPLATRSLSHFVFISRFFLK